MTVWDVRSSKPLSAFRSGSLQPPAQSQTPRGPISRPPPQSMYPDYTSSYPTSSIVDYRNRVEELLRETSPRSPAVGSSREPRLEAFLREARSRRQSDASATASPIGSPVAGLTRNPAVVRRRRFTEAAMATEPPSTMISPNDSWFHRSETEAIADSTAAGEETSDMDLDPSHTDALQGTASGSRLSAIAAALFEQAQETGAGRISTGSVPRPRIVTERPPRPHAVRTFDDLLTNVICRTHVQMPPDALIRSWPERHPTVLTYGEPGRGSPSWLAMSAKRGEGTDRARPMNPARALKFSPSGKTNGARDLLVFTEVRTTRRCYAQD